MNKNERALLWNVEHAIVKFAVAIKIQVTRKLCAEEYGNANQKFLESR